MTTRVVSVLLWVVLGLAPSTAASALYYTGDGYVAAGRTDTISSSDGFDFILNSTPSRNYVSFYINDFATNPSFQDCQFFNLLFAAPSGSDLQVGDYENATRAPFQAPGSPGLWFAGNGRGSNEITGSFRILAISFASDDTLTSLAVDFVQNEEKGLLGQSYGSFRYNSDVPLTTTFPEPATIVLVAVGVTAAAVRVRKKGRISRRTA